MHEETLYIETQNVLHKLECEELLHSFYLAGGTALALQLGHRKSIDLDFFTSAFPNPQQLLAFIQRCQGSVTRQDSKSVDLLIWDKVKQFLLAQTL
ncbi:MAG: hypothetical protein UW36_C0001G0002 [candidate division WWE3 bacterium GW2011_GWA2_44_16]|uniref:Uncharacterized protein n=1 Tax=candidate division WWE3 bacterium GW2011_GWA2_44_16 TaxID=1619110 RepID=A0A0G1KD15_UNCKA|nr:MAG: hypothetical protein UW36_C0001G0002 [candidate division WWE3 bacterium GW2011_GWA2_44_16]